ncbi:uncharacterized protein JN550_002704 [Neoarthrinium moseri]|uniref:uncharacterized protein n=1 Tax=Neoarthrinium moseri TaxID=1658444 RepID=UPI001FDC5E5E|nr:uncharacterized protein JN550_002704 [Neoarthrinium moseri]KAI1874125.1 hypothetical protein JN550_002704 [Neoarthrinium moseri]
MYDRTPRDGVWLADDPSYQDRVHSLSSADPRLKNRDSKAQNQKIPWDDANARIISLELGIDQQSTQLFNFDNHIELETYLAKGHTIHAENDRTSTDGGNGASANSTCSRYRVIIMEGLSPKYIGILGKHFSLHPSLFVEHERVVVINKRGNGESDSLPLPSTMQQRNHVVLRYFEPLVFNSVPNNSRLVCGSTGRHIAISRNFGERSEVGTVHRKCSIWWTTRNGTDGWDCLVLCDPPVTNVRTGFQYNESFTVNWSPYQGGYVDFLPARCCSHEVGPGPPRTSLMNDLIYYLTVEQRHVDITSPATSVHVFAHKIIASHYLKHSEHLRATLWHAQRGLNRRHELNSLTMDQVEDLWSDIQAWERRMGEYCEALELIMLQIGIPLETPGSTHSFSKRMDWKDSTVDYQFLLMRFRELRHITECLNSAITGLANIAGNRAAFKEQQLAAQEAKRNIRETKRTKAITLLGLVFIPLAYVSSLFSMGEPFRPGDTQFWVYFVASVPLIALTLLAYCALDWGYSDDSADWSPKTFSKHLQVRVGLKRPSGLIQEEPQRSYYSIGFDGNVSAKHGP